MAKVTSYNVSRYLLHRLYQLGSKHLFVVCGDFLLGFLDQVLASDVKLINCCNELNAGYAADGYARLNGLCAVATTYAVGELSALNAIAGAYAEYVPVVKIAGAPDMSHQLAGRMLHHTLGDYAIPRDIYRKVTVACEFITSAANAPEQIDQALAKCLYYKRPVYFELPANLVTQKCDTPAEFKFINEPSHPQMLQEALQEATAMLTHAKQPIVLLGLEIFRHGLQTQVQALLEKAGLPYCTLTTGKSLLSEDHPQFVGCYKGNWSRDYVKNTVEQSDCILMLGCFFTDFDTGGFTSRLDPEKLIRANFEQLTVKYHMFPRINLTEFIEKLKDQLPSKKFNDSIISAKARFAQNTKAFEPEQKAKLTVKRFFERVSSFFKPNDIIIAEVGEAIFSLASCLLPKNATFINQTFYSSIGYTVGATLGACLAQPERRVILFVGDGSFQLTAQEISTMLRYNVKPTIFLLNNAGYAIERAIHDGPYNDLQPWRYHLLPQALGGNVGLDVHTEDELEKALVTAEKHTQLTFIEIHTDKFDFGDTMRQAGAALAESSKHSYE